MRWNTLVMLGLAAVFGLAAVLVGQRWAARQAARPVAVSEQPAPVAVSTIVVAAQPLRYGIEVTARSLREVPWPAEAVPAGAFRTIAEVHDGQPGRRIALAAIEVNEPLLASKMTGTGQRATLSNLIDEGMGAVTVQVNEVVGVAGFVMPGDRVDVLLTRRPPPSDGAAAAPQPFSDVVIQNVRVLAVGQIADEKSDKPFVVNAVTLEVDPVAAQKVSLAANAGSLSLMLRKAGDVAARAGRRVSAAEIGQGSSPATDSLTATVRVTRGTRREEYSVPVMEARRPAVFPQVAAAAP